MIKLNHLLYVIKISQNLLSINQPTNDNLCTIILDAFNLKILNNKIGKLFLIGSCHMGLYYIIMSTTLTPQQTFISIQQYSSWWNHKSGHQPPNIFIKLFKYLPKFICSYPITNCTSYVISKCKRLSLLL